MCYVRDLFTRLLGRTAITPGTFAVIDALRMPSAVALKFCPPRSGSHWFAVQLPGLVYRKCVRLFDYNRKFGLAVANGPALQLLPKGFSDCYFNPRECVCGTVWASCIQWSRCWETMLVLLPVFLGPLSRPHSTNSDEKVCVECAQVYTINDAAVVAHPY